jgi:hypothetical protein
LIAIFRRELTLPIVNNSVGVPLNLLYGTGGNHVFPLSIDIRGTLSMNKYENILNNSEEFTDVKLTPSEGIAAIAMIALMADEPDGEVDPDAFMDILSSFELFDEYAEADMLAMISKLTEIADEESLGALFNAADDVEVISDDLVPDAFAIAVATLIDENQLMIPASKKAFLLELQTALDVDTEEAKTIIEDVIATLQSDDAAAEPLS